LAQGIGYAEICSSALSSGLTTGNYRKATWHVAAFHSANDPQADLISNATGFLSPCIIATSQVPLLAPIASLPLCPSAP